MACLNEKGKKPEAIELIIERIVGANVLEISLRKDVGMMSSWEDFILEMVLMISVVVVGSLITKKRIVGWD